LEQQPDQLAEKQKESLKMYQVLFQMV